MGFDSNFKTAKTTIEIATGVAAGEELRITTVVAVTEELRVALIIQVVLAAMQVKLSRLIREVEPVLAGLLAVSLKDSNK